jgi:ESS family glutamate:Na+ symporter
MMARATGVEFWRSSLVDNVLGLAVLLAIAGALRTHVGVLRRLAIPDGIVAGALGLVLGPNLLHAMPLSGRDLEPLVYHGFAIVFVAVGLQGAQRVRATGSARSLSFGFVGLAVVQSLLGFALIGIWMAASDDTLHPGLGFMITLGFAQGPGQALAFGSAWEPLGLVNGAQIGLLYAALGFAWCCVLGVPLVAFARRRGWLDPPPASTPEALTITESVTSTGDRTGTMEPLTVQIVTIGCVYAAVFGVLWSITRALPADSNIAASLWGFHFLVGSSLAIALRKIIDTGRVRIPLHDGLLARIAGTAIDFTTAAALSAIQLDMLGDVLVPILVMSSIGGVLTLVLCLWLTRRAFDEAPFSHMLVLYGTCTGTVPTGLALLRIVDPELRGPVARSTVIAATAAVPLGMPLFLGVIPLSIAQWSGSFAQTLVITLGMLAVYVVVLVWIWHRTGSLRWLRPLTSVWPRASDPDA